MVNDEGEITLCSLNCQGLGTNDPTKRRDVLNYLRGKNFSIICLQDTHFSKDVENTVRAEWGYSCFFSSFSSRSRGVAVFFKNNFEFQIHKVIDDEGNGNCLILDLSTNDKRITLVNLYAPNRDEPLFFENIMKHIQDLNNQNIICTGDWNLVLDPNKDTKNYKNINNPRAREKVFELMVELNLIDVWREANPDASKYTWKRRISDNMFQMARLDFILMSENIHNYSQKEKISPGYRTDHSLVACSLKFRDAKKKKTLWKFNNSLLRHIDYVKKIKEVILHCKKEYAVTPIAKEKIEQLPNDLYQSTINPQLFLEMLFLRIREESIRFSKQLKRTNENTTKILMTEISELEDKLNVGDSTVLDELDEKREELQSIRETRLKGTLIRSRARWLLNGEKPTRYFCNMENRNFTSKRMSSLIKENGTEIFEDDEITREVASFYEKLYSSREYEVDNTDLNEIATLQDVPKLTEESALKLEGPLTYSEVFDALRKMKSNKSPGSDGFTVEFLKYFWPDIGQFLLNSLNYGFEIKYMSSTQREGIVTCIPKGDKSKKYVKNWRPITLLNVVYKIAASAIANRLKKVLPLIINKDQCGFMTGRFTGDNIRLIYDILNYAQLIKKKGLLILIDFEKAFDSVAWSFLFKCLHFFKFGSSFIDWIKLFIKDIKCRVQVNGSLSDWFEVERGCRQGDPLSPYLFLICSEIMAHMIRNDKDIKGYKYNQLDIKLTQYADDTTAFLDGSRASFEKFIHTLIIFGQLSGLKMNLQKTKMVWFGCTRPPETKFMEHMGFEWNPESFTVLGIIFTTSLDDITENNITHKLDGVRKDLGQWSKRSLTPIGKITVIKSLILSKITHILISLPNPSEKTVQYLNQLFFKFIWDNKPDKIKRTIINRPFEQGGLNMVDLGKFIAALKISWIRRLIVNNSLWKDAMLKNYPRMQSMCSYGTDFLYKVIKEVNNPFWRDVFHAMMEYADCLDIKTMKQFNSLSFLYNKNIQVDRGPITICLLPNNDIYFIHQLKNEAGEFLSYIDFTHKYQITINPLTYMAVVRAVRLFQTKFTFNQEINENYEIPITYKSVIMLNKGSKLYYNTLTSQITKPKGVAKWREHLDQQNWTEYFTICTRITSDTKLLWFQYRILHYALTTNKTISRFNSDQCALCQFCGLQEEEIYHLLWSCEVVQTFWISLQEHMASRCAHLHRVVFNSHLILFGFSETVNTEPTYKLILLFAKFFIYKCKVFKKLPTLRNFIRVLTHRYKIEKETHVMEKKLNKFEAAWAPYVAALDINTST